MCGLVGHDMLNPPAELPLLRLRVRMELHDKGSVGWAGPAHEGLWKYRELRQTAGMSSLNGAPQALLFAQHFAMLPDPRQRLPQHPLLSILFIVLAAQLCGAEGWDAMVGFARAKQAWLASFLELLKGIPSADTLRRVMGALAPQVFVACFRAWVGALAGALKGEVGAVEGKAIKGASEATSRTPPLYLVHVWATEQRLLVGQQAVAGAPGESPGAEAVLKLLALTGAVVTGDANLGTKRVAQTVMEQGADYVLALKGNRGPVHTQVRQFWQGVAAQDFTGVAVRRVRRLNTGHGRTEERRSFAVAARQLPPLVQRWPGVAAVLRVERIRSTVERTQHERHYYLSSLPPKVQTLHYAIRQHWRVENDLHWCLDVSVREDHCRIRDLRAAENVAMVRRMALPLLKRQPGETVGVPLRRLRAGWDNAYLVQVLSTGLT
jgi:predicted transposase YbfD/YdcC